MVARAAHGEAGYWTLTRHRDVQQAALDPVTYSSWLGGTNLRDEPPDRLAVSRFILLNIDPPQHTRHRRLVTRAFRCAPPRRWRRAWPRCRG